MKTQEANVETKSSAEKLLEVIQDMHRQEQVVTTEALLSHGDLKDQMTTTQINNRLKYLADNGHIVRVQRGVFVPTEVHAPARPVYLSICPDGAHVLEVGETKLVLTPREARAVGQAMAGAGQQFVAIELGHSATQTTARLARQLRAVQGQLNQLANAAGFDALAVSEAVADA